MDTNHRHCRLYWLYGGRWNPHCWKWHGTENSRFSGRTGPAYGSAKCSTNGTSDIIVKIENDERVILNGFELIEIR